MNLFAQILKTENDNLDAVVAQSDTSDNGTLKLIALGGLILFVALVVAILVARRR